jgi:membrane fusion protein, copper/silver efflux system
MKPIIKFTVTAAVLMGLNGFLPGALGLKNFELVPGTGTAMAAEKLKAGMVDPKTGKKIKYWAAPMDPTYIRNEPGQSPMGMDLIPVYEEEGEEKEPASTIRIDPVTVQNMGVRLGKVHAKKLTKSIRAFGNITYDETRLYSVNTKFDGWIEKLHVDFLGDRVTKGQPLFDIYSPELFAAQQEYLLALQQRDTMSSNVSKSVRSGAQRMLNATRKRLEYWDLTPKQIDRIEQTGEISKTITVFSPADGVVTLKKAFEGHYVKAGVHQYEIADLSRVWVDVEIYEYEFPWIEKGMPAEMTLAYIPGKKFQGHVLYVYPYMEPITRTAKLRLEFDNLDLKLKPNMYADVYLKSALPAETLVVPQEAVIDSGVRKIVFVSQGNGRFEPREITSGVEGDNYEVQVLEGLKAGEKIVVSGQFMLDSESRLQEAIRKMLAARQQTGTTEEQGEDLDVSDLSMDGDTPDDDLDMSDLKMDDPSTGKN